MVRRERFFASSRRPNVGAWTTYATHRSEVPAERELLELLAIIGGLREITRGYESD